MIRKATLQSGPRRSVGAAREEETPGPVVICGNIPFHSPWQRPQQLAVHLAAAADVVYVDPNRSFLRFLRRKNARSNAPAHHCPARLRQFSPPGGCPLARWYPAINRLNYSRAIPRLIQFLRRQRLWPPRVLIATFPDQLEAVRLLSGLPLIYDVMDEPLLFLKAGQKAVFRQLHGDLLRRADYIVTSSRVLFQRYSPLARRAVCISNGVDERLSRSTQNGRMDPELARLPQPRLGYIGTIAHWFDFSAVRNLAAAFPGGSVILVGPVECPCPQMPPNVHFMGMLPHHKLGPVLRSFDLGIIPFLRSPEIDAVNPVKLYEYLAAGLPVLTSDFTEISDFAGLVTIYKNAADCTPAARSLMAVAPDERDRQRRREFAASHSWLFKAQQYMQVIHEVVS